MDTPHCVSSPDDHPKDASRQVVECKQKHEAQTQQKEFSRPLLPAGDSLFLFVGKAGAVARPEKQQDGKARELECPTFPRVLHPIKRCCCLRATRDHASQIADYQRCISYLRVATQLSSSTLLAAVPSDSTLCCPSILIARVFL